MNPLIVAASLVSLASALAAVVLGQVLTRSVLAGHVAVAALGLACLAAGGGVLALCLIVFGLVWLAIVQLFGWMLVDVDHDHLPALAWRTTSLRMLALAAVAAGIGLFARTALRTGQLATPSAVGQDRVAIDPVAVGGLFIGAGNELAQIAGLLLAAGLLTALCLLRDEGSEAG